MAAPAWLVNLLPTYFPTPSLTRPRTRLCGWFTMHVLISGGWCVWGFEVRNASRSHLVSWHQLGSVVLLRACTPRQRSLRSHGAVQAMFCAHLVAGHVTQLLLRLGRTTPVKVLSTQTITD